MKRLLCLISCMNRGGAETFLMKVYRALDRTRLQMDFCINVAEKCDYEDEIYALGGQIFRIPSKTENASAFKSQLTRIVCDNGYETVLRITSSAVGFWDLKIAKQAGALRTIARSSNASDGKGVAQAILHKVGQLLWTKYVDVKIAPSDLAAEYTFGKKLYQSGKVTILPNGLDLGVFHFEPDERIRVRKEFGIAEETQVLGHIGRFNLQKNHEFLLDVFSVYLQEHKDAVLLLVGEGTLRNEIEVQARSLGIVDKVIFTGLRIDVPALLSAMDVLVFPSFYEGMPNVVIEAQACGLPCVISDTITREADVAGMVTFLPINDTECWVKEIEALCGKRNTKKMPIEYDIRNVVEEFSKLCFSGGE